MTLLEGRTAVVTGAASGIGRSSAIRMAAEGANVVLADINDPGLAEVHEAITAAGGASSICRTDITDDDQTAALIAHTLATFGAVDILHNNAAAVGPEMLRRDLDLASTTLETWDATFAVTLRGQFSCARHAIGPMVAAGRGSIVNMSSSTGLGGERVRTAYSAAKAGVNALTRSIATQYGKQGVRCNAVSPGFVLTPPARLQVPPRDLAVYQDNCLTPDLGTPEDVAAVVAFLASDEARYITGQVISVDGGSFSHLGTLAAFRQIERADAAG